MSAPSPVCSKSTDLHVDVAGKPILKGLNLSLAVGEVSRHHGPERFRQEHACQRHRGPAGLRRHPGSVRYLGASLTDLEPEKRARASACSWRFSIRSKFPVSRTWSS